jgi:hypothetical protein
MGVKLGLSPLEDIINKLRAFKNKDLRRILNRRHKKEQRVEKIT